MSNDNNNDKVIDLFAKSSNTKDQASQKCFKGIPYVKLTKDLNGNMFKEENLREYAQKCFYIVSVMRTSSLGAALYKYKVPYEELISFLFEFKNNKSYGEIIDIEKYIPEDLA